jgi:transcription antitermination factor NusG
MHWHAIVVKPQYEKAVAKAFNAKALESYLPTYTERHRWSDRVRKVEVPLFSRYVFCRSTLEDRFAVLSTPGVVSVVSFAGKPAEISETEISSIKAMIGSGLPVAPCECITVGERVRITEGCLAGVEGILVRQKSPFRVVVNVGLLQRAVIVEIDRDLLKTAKHD